MYKEITIENIKIFKKEQKLKLKPITLLYGENSSGKTTLLKTFDIVHNIFAEYHVKGGKNVSEKKDVPFYRNENIQNISAKKIHYFSSQINKKPLNNNIKNSIKLHIAPNDDGFTCAIEIEDSCKKIMTPEQLEMCVSIAHGLAHMAITDPSEVFRMGVHSQAEKAKKLSEKKKKNSSNVIDFLIHLKKKRDEEQWANFEEEIQDPF